MLKLQSSDLHDLITLVTPFAITLIGIIQFWFAKWMLRRARHEKATLVEATAAQVASNKFQEQKLIEIHVLVNNRHAVALRAAAVALRRIAELTKLREDSDAATAAETIANDHDTRQEFIDSMKNREEEKKKKE